MAEKTGKVRSGIADRTPSRRVPMALRVRPWTPDKRITKADGTTSTRMHVKRACNGCGALLGDVTDAEMDAAVTGGPPPDVRTECPFCQRSHHA